MNLRITYHNREMSVRLIGAMDADTVLENLSSHLQLAHQGSSLRVDLGDGESLGYLALSALVVLLRVRCGRFANTSLTGLRRPDKRFLLAGWRRVQLPGRGLGGQPHHRRHVLLQTAVGGRGAGDDVGPPRPGMVSPGRSGGVTNGM